MQSESWFSLEISLLDFESGGRDQSLLNLTDCKARRTLTLRPFDIVSFAAQTEPCLAPMRIGRLLFSDNQSERFFFSLSLHPLLNPFISQLLKSV